MQRNILVGARIDAQINLLLYAEKIPKCTGRSRAPSAASMQIKPNYQALTNWYCDGGELGRAPEKGADNTGGRSDGWQVGIADCKLSFTARQMYGYRVCDWSRAVVFAVVGAGPRG